MSKVYFREIKDFSDKELINNTVYEMLETINFDFKGTVPLKVHFGEKGNTTFIRPDNFEGIKRYLKAKNINTCYIETNVLYKGSRTETKNHIKTAIDHGFDDLDIIIADDNNKYDEIEVNLKHFKKCKIGKRYSEFSNYIVISHFKGHALAGIGAALKQLAMGYASRGGKLHQHDDSIPTINKSRCNSCGYCLKTCPVDAIEMLDKANIIRDKCIGCAACSVSCPINAIVNSWNGNNFQEKIAEYAYAASLGKNNIYITYAFNITEDCDCVGMPMEIIADDIGIFLSTDPVAIDKACYDKFSETNNHHFDAVEITLNYAEKLGVGSKEYELIEI